MAELIDKGALYDAMTEEYKKHYAGTGKGYDFTIAMQMVQNQPTTTEAEIRAKAIDEFAEKIRDWQKEVYTNDRYAGELDFLFKHIYEIAEQLKERE